MCSEQADVRLVPEADIAPAAHSNKAAGNAGAQRTRGDIAFAEMTGRCVASAMAMLLGHPGRSPGRSIHLEKSGRRTLRRPRTLRINIQLIKVAQMWPQIQCPGLGRT